MFERTNGRPSLPGWAWGLITIVTMGALFALTVILTSRKNVTDYELGLLQFILFAAGTLVTFMFGRKSVRAEAEDLTTPSWK